MVSGRIEGNFVAPRLNILENVPVWNAVQDQTIDSLPLPVPNGWVLTTIARTNPSRPVVTPFEIIENIIQLPRQLTGLLRLLRDPRSRMTPQGVASEYLGVQFGWKPMIEDFRKILDYQSHVLKRAKMLSDLQKGAGLRRRIQLASDNKSSSAYEDVACQGTTFVRARCSVTVAKRVWATVRWKPTAPPPYHPSDPRYHAYLKRIVLGLTPEGLALGAWKVIPWTWLIGWFTNIGDYTLLYSNTVPASATNLCIMSESKLSLVPTGTSIYNHGLSATAKISGSYTRTRKTRGVGSAATPGVNMPFMDMYRQSILGALAIQKVRF